MLTPTSNAHGNYITHCMDRACPFYLTQPAAGWRVETVPRQRSKTKTSAGAGERSTNKMKGRSVLALLIVAFVGWNLLLGASVKSSDPAYQIVELNGRRLKEVRHAITSRSLQGITTDDYQPVDPSPSSKASIRPGPIEHGAPLFPYVPGSPPPAQSPTSPVA